MTAAEAMETGTSTSGKSAPASKGIFANKKLWGALVVISIVGGTVGGVVGGIMGAPGRQVKGTWKTNFGSYVTITDTQWCSVSSWGKGCDAVQKFGGNAYVIVQKPADDKWNPSKFQKAEYHTISTGLAYCTSVMGEATLAAAESKDTTGVYTATDKAKGCNGFSFTELTKHADQSCNSASDVKKCLSDLMAADKAGR